MLKVNNHLFMPAQTQLPWYKFFTIDKIENYEDCDLLMVLLIHFLTTNKF